MRKDPRGHTVHPRDDGKDTQPHTVRPCDRRKDPQGLECYSDTTGRKGPPRPNSLGDDTERDHGRGKKDQATHIGCVEP